jgi:tetratricopeptide (TPR) repeat protein
LNECIESIQNENYNEAVNLAEKALEIKKDSLTHYYAGVAYYYADNIALSLLHLQLAKEKASKNQKKMANIQIMLGVVYKDLGVIEKATDYLNQAILNPQIQKNQKSFAYIKLTEIYKDFDIDKAIDCGLIALNCATFKEQKLEVYNMLGECYKIINDISKSISCLEKAKLLIKDQTDLEYLKLDLADLYLQNKDYDKARRLYSSLIKSNDNQIKCNAYKGLGLINQTKNKTDALANFKKALDYCEENDNNEILNLINQSRKLTIV